MSVSGIEVKRNFIFRPDQFSNSIINLNFSFGSLRMMQEKWRLFRSHAFSHFKCMGSFNEYKSLIQITLRVSKAFKLVRNGYVSFGYLPVSQRSSWSHAFHYEVMGFRKPWEVHRGIGPMSVARTNVFINLSEILCLT